VFDRDRPSRKRQQSASGTVAGSQLPGRPQAAPSLIAVEAAWDCVWHVVETATWRNALACALAFLSRILPLPTDDITAHVLLTLCALNLGAVVGKLLDRRPNSARSSRRQVRNGHRATVPDSIPR